jgi:hypothetical protein
LPGIWHCASKMHLKLAESVTLTTTEENGNTIIEHIFKIMRENIAFFERFGYYIFWKPYMVER